MTAAERRRAEQDATDLAEARRDAIAATRRPHLTDRLDERQGVSG